MTAREIIVVCLVMLGAIFSVLASVGLLRMPDVFTRMQSATKAGTLGVACTAAAAAIHFGRTFAAIEAVMVVFFFFLTAPVASHLVARVAYTSGSTLWKRTIRDDYAKDRAKRAQDVARSTADSPPVPSPPTISE